MKTANTYQDILFNAKRPIIKVLLETDFTKELRIVMQRGTIMKEHKTSYPIVIEILEGDINFELKDETKQLVKGALIALDGNVVHGLKANKNTIIRLTLTKKDTATRVEKITRK
ncbi:cupin [Tenacibaculum sp. C7A-26P2]|uniref:cupin n=1 Tax=Tenacibaculum sp. C7A-26P2 TaxID=3447504 RepID=UPI003F84F140